MADTIKLSHVSKSYAGRPVVMDVSLSLPEGYLMALVGHNGAGKSTLIKLMLGLTRPTQGEIGILGQDPLSPGGMEARSNTGFLPENVVFEGALSGREVMTFFARLKGEPVAKSLELFDLVGLSHAVDMKVKTYSKGMRQRLGLAQAFLGEPRLLLLDEPTSGLDSAAQIQFYNIVKMLKERGASILISSHALTELEAQADLIAMMNSGHLMACASIGQLREIAGLPSMLRLSVRDGKTSEVAERLKKCGAPTKINGTHVEIAISPDDKMTTLRKVGQLGKEVLDVDVYSPSLDMLYTAFCQRRENGR
ncbi:MAG: ABC transporter ATP-binding protein [Alphaproteobacteria bacterium]|nr:ABC transporter ATP-binding protein [Alphaproteobacteria bacterium]